MATYTGAQKARPTFATADCGPWADDNAVTVTANLTTADAIVAMDVPAGVRLHTLRYRAGDLDTGGIPSLTMNIGYRTKLPGGSQTNLTYFGAALTGFQAAQASWVEAVFNPIKFDEPVEIVLTPAANGAALGTAAVANFLATGVLYGVT